MQRMRRVAEVWNWLPAFRAIAETGTLGQTSEQFGASPSALSRTIRQLEEHLGRTLFERNGRGLTPTSEGQEFLLGVREAMRRVHAAMERLERATFHGPIRLAGDPALLAHLALPAFVRLAERHPELIPRLVARTDADVVRLLSVGRADVALLMHPFEAPDLTTAPLARLDCRVFAANNHPCLQDGSRWVGHSFALLAGNSDPDTERVMTVDGWPAEISRKVGLVSDAIHGVVEACQTGRYLGFLPTTIAGSHGLRFIDSAPTGSTQVYIMHRSHLSLQGRTEAMLDAIQEHVASIE